MTEAQYLDHQIQGAKAAIGRVVDQMKTLGQDAADPRPYVEQYPWISVGVAIAAGFVAGTALTPARGQGIGERLSNLVPGGGGGGGKQKSPMRFVTTPLIRLARTALVGALSGAMGAKAGKDEDERPRRPYAEARPYADAEPYGGPPVAPGGVAFVSAGGGSVPEEPPRQQATTP